MANTAAEAARNDFYNQPSQGILQSIDNNIDAAVQMFIFDVFNRLVIDYRAVIVNLAIVSILVYAFQIYKGRVGSSIEEVAERVFVIFIVFALLFNMGWFIQFLHTVFMQWPEEIIRSIVSSMSSVTVQNTNQDAIKGTLDVYLDQTWKLGMETANRGSITSPFPWIMAFWIITIGFLLAVIPFGMSAVASVATGVLLAMTPLFLTFLFFKKTTGFFESWIRALMTMMFLKILAYTVMVLSLFILKSPMSGMVQKVGIEGEFKMSNYMAFLVSAFVIFMFYRNISGMAAGLGSGFTVQASRVAESGYGKLRSIVK